MTKKIIEDDYPRFKESLRLQTVHNLSSLDILKVGDVVIDLVGPNKKKNRLGSVTKIEDKNVYISYEDYELITELKFYGDTWGLKK